MSAPPLTVDGLHRPLPRPKRAEPLLLVIAVGGLLALGLVLARLAGSAGVAPSAFAFWHAAGGAALVGLLALAQPAAAGAGRPIAGAVVRYSLLVGLLSLALPNAIAFAAVQVLGTGQVGLVYALPPILTYGIVLILGLERAARGRIAGVGLSTLGLILALAPSAAEGSSGSLSWWILLLAVPVSIAAANVYRSLRWPAGAAPVLLAFGMLAGAALWLLPLMAWTGVWLPLPGTPGAVPVLLQMGVSALTFALYFRLQRIGGPVVLSQIGPISAVGSLALGILLLGETHSLWLLASLPLVLAGAALVARRPSPST